MGTSLLRFVSGSSVAGRFRDIVMGAAERTSYRFVFLATPRAGAESLHVEISVVPESRPPTNVHALIGRNGVGKTRLLAGMAMAPFLTTIGIGSLIRAGSFSLFGDALIEGEGLAWAAGALVALSIAPLLVPAWRAWLVAQLRNVR